MPNVERSRFHGSIGAELARASSLSRRRSLAHSAPHPRVPRDAPASRASGRDDDGGGNGGGGADRDRARSRARSRLEAKRDRAFVFGAEMFPTRRFVSLTSARDDSRAPLAHLRVDVAPAVRVLLRQGPL
jgi:hypothetical protein